MKDSNKPDQDNERQEPIVSHKYVRTDQEPDNHTENKNDNDAVEQEDAAEKQETAIAESKPVAESELQTEKPAPQEDAAEDEPTSEPDPNQTTFTLETPQPAKPEAAKTPHCPKRKKKGGFKKFCIFLLVLIILLGLTIGGLFVYFAQTNQYPIQTVKVVGEYQYVKESDIITVLKPYIVNKGLFAFSEWQAEAALEKIPGVADASIWRIPPDKIKVIIRERPAVARFADGALLSDKGMVFKTSNTEGASDLPLLNGNPIYGKDMLTMLTSLEPIFATIDAKVTGLDLAENGDWSVQLNDQTWIMLGKKDLTDRVQDFLTAYPVLMKSAASGASLSYVDLLYSHGFAASWTGGSSNS